MYDRPLSNPNLNPEDDGDDPPFCKDCDDFHQPGEHIATTMQESNWSRCPDCGAEKPFDTECACGLDLEDDE